LKDRKNILICPLEWGLGHAGRMVPLAKKLQELNHNVFFGSGEDHLRFFRSEVPGASIIHFPGFKIRYSRYLPQYLIILLQSPLLICHSFLEHYRIKRIIRDYSIDILISDNRIGLWNSGIKTVYITHQLRIIFPAPFRFLEFLAVKINRSIINKYTFCFIPDLKGELNISGKLSHGLMIPENVRYIGILSRLNGNSPAYSLLPGQCTVMLSGPEPQRSILKQKLEKILISQAKSAIILEGKPSVEAVSRPVNNLIYYNHLPSDETIKLLKESEIIITRSGYTTLMELVSLGCSALLIPTPGQTEQEYLAKSLSAKGWFSSMSQHDLKEKTDLLSPRAVLPSGIEQESRRLLEIALAELLEE
jgi:UDP-N-acetylglucosamine transferase subunit ALG13